MNEVTDNGRNIIEIDDVEAHRLDGGHEAAPADGASAQGIVLEEEDDVEGHRASRVNPDEDDVQGHVQPRNDLDIER